MRRIVVALGALALACGSSGDGHADVDGTEGHSCFPNETCNAGLSCLSKLCVVDPSNGAGGAETAGVGGGSGIGTGGAVSAGGSAVGAGGTSTAAGGSTSGGGGAVAQPLCFTVSVTNSTAAEKVNAALCVGLALPDQFACHFDVPTNSTKCVGSKLAYVVLYSETASGTVGDIYDLSNDQYLGSLIQGVTGSYDITFDNGLAGSCVVNGDVATLCLTASH